MNDELNKKIRQISDILGQDNIPENVKGLFTLFANSSSTPESTSNNTYEPPLENFRQPHLNLQAPQQHNENDENLEMFSRIKKVLDRANTLSDPRINLLTAVKPFLNSTRQKKVSHCIKLLQMSGLAKLIDETDSNT